MDSPDDIYSKEQVPPLARRRQPPIRTTPPDSASPPPGSPTLSPRVVKLEDHRRFQSHRRRSRGHERPSHRVNLLFWGLVALVVFGYLGVLAFSVIQKKFKKPAAVAAPAKNTNAPPAVALSSEDSSAIRDSAEVSRKIVEKMRAWSSAQHDVGEANLLEHNGKFEQAERRLSQALEGDPDLLDGRFELAQILYQQKKYREAEDMLVEVLAADPGRESARLMLAGAYAGQRLHKPSLDVTLWILEADPDLIDAHVLAGQAYMNLDQPAQAVDHWKKVTNVQRDNVAAYNSLAQAYMKMNRQRDAIETLSKVLEIDDKNSATYYNLAICHAQMNNAQPAVDALSRAAGLFGNAFVATWMQGADFEIIRTNSAFVEFQNLLASTGVVRGATAEISNAAPAEAAATVTP